MRRLENKEFADISWDDINVDQIKTKLSKDETLCQDSVAVVPSVPDSHPEQSEQAAEDQTLSEQGSPRQETPKMSFRSDLKFTNEDF